MRKIFIILLLICNNVNAQMFSQTFYSLLNGGGGSPPARHNLILSTSFEGSPFNFGFLNCIIGLPWGNFQHCCDTSILASTKYAREGVQSMRVEVTRGEPYVSGSPRSEVTRDIEPSNVERWYGHSLYLSNVGYEDYVVDYWPESVWQWHHDNASGSPPLALYTENGRWEVVRKETPNGNDIYHDLGAYQKGVWTDWVWHIKWSTTNGIIQLWKDGALVLNLSGIPTSFPEGNYLKAGIYKFAWKIVNPNPPFSTNHRVIYYDAVREGTAAATYYDVAPGNY